jgi:nucleotide-binding universal stress UspA family protein
MYRTILLAFDGSLEGARALREGTLMARRCGAKVVLLSVVPDAGGAEMAEGVYASVAGSQIESYQELLKSALHWLKARGFDATAKIAFGEPAPAIGKVAKDVGADLVVVGHRQTNFLSRWWSGSTNAYLSDTITCSLLIGRTTLSDEAYEIELEKANAHSDAVASS